MFDDRRERLDAYLDEENLAAVWFAGPASFAWLTGGDNVVDRYAGAGVAAAGYDGDGLTVVTNNIERDRLRDEELPGNAIVEAFSWHSSSLAEAVAARSPTPAAADFDVPGFETLDASPLRQPLSDRDRDRYRSIGADAAAALEAAARAADPDDLEQEIATDVECRLARRDLESPVVLIGGSERAQEYRHYTPSTDRLGRYALLSAVGRRDGLHASVTRAVAFDEPRWFAKRTRAAARVEATALAATRAVGREDGTAADVFGEIRRAYEAVGFEDEWEHHHQGGAAGYASREWKASPSSSKPIALPMAFAYNPTVQGAKSEGTWLVREGGVTPVTPAGDGWPTETVDAVGFDREYELPMPLGLER